MPYKINLTVNTKNNFYQLYNYFSNLFRLHCDTQVFSINEINTGGNNRLFKIKDNLGSNYIGKKYFSHPYDNRNRLKHDFDVSRYFWSIGVRNIPRPIVSDPENNICLFDYINGDRPIIQNITSFEIEEAIKFIRRCNFNKVNNEGKKLPSAAEACFDFHSHKQSVNKRIILLNKIKNSDSSFITTLVRLNLLWKKCIGRLNQSIKSNSRRISFIDEEQKIISPSDFGFHNALCDKSGQLFFLDFEYAGWDDPAKLMCDFANQPDFLLPNSLSNKFSQSLIDRDPYPEELRNRYILLLPLYQIKWVCIILNVFLDIGVKRYEHLGNGMTISSIRQTQLKKANIMLDRAKFSMDSMS